MRNLFEAAISGNEWDEEKRKSDYSKWMKDKLIHALYNTVPVIKRYRKLQVVPMNQEELAAFLTKVSSFCDITKNWLKKLQKIAAHWEQCTPTEMLLRGSHLIHFSKKVRVSYWGRPKEGGYRAI
jgi:hypothetical protein